jgi:hypothetical protein
MESRTKTETTLARLPVSSVKSDTLSRDLKEGKAIQKLRKAISTSTTYFLPLFL